MLESVITHSLKKSGLMNKSDFKLQKEKKKRLNIFAIIERVILAKTALVKWCLDMLSLENFKNFHAKFAKTKKSKRITQTIQNRWKSLGCAFGTIEPLNTIK